MAEFLAVPIHAYHLDRSVSELLGSSDATGSVCQSDVSSGDWRIGEYHREDAPVSGARCFEDGRWVVAHAGDLVNRESVPYRQIIGALEQKDFEFFAELEGVFGIVAYDRQNQAVFAVSDRRGQKPIFYQAAKNLPCISTSLACLVRLLGRPEFDRKWLWQSLYFNFPVDEATFLKDVARLPAATVLILDTRSGKLTLHSYADDYRQRGPLLRGKSALRHAAGVFGDRVPRYYKGAGEVACALTGGWDGRTIVALAPNDTNIVTYTYGGPGCADLIGAARAAKAIGARHIQIPFDSAFVSELRNYALETVYLSGGLQNVLRSSLYYVYRNLTDTGRRFPLTVSGISLGTQLRGAAQFPDLISIELARRFQGRSNNVPADRWRDVWGDDTEEFAQYIETRLGDLEQRFGSFTSPVHHLSFGLYPASANYFCGELALSEKFTTVRVPAWDSELVELNYAIENSTITLSSFASTRRHAIRKQMLLQAYLLKEFSPDLYSLPVRGIHPATLLSGEIPYQAERAYRALTREIAKKVSGYRPKQLENWDAWLFDQNYEFLDEMLQSSETRIRDYVSPAFVDTTISNKDTRVVGKLLTSEIVLRLIDSGWSRFWSKPD